MAKVEAFIGKEEGQHRLLVKIGQKAFVVGNPQSVPNTVSRSHCSLSVEYTDDQARKVTKIKIQNLKPQNITYVDGQEVESKAIKENSHVQLGFDRYNMDLKQVVDGMRKLLPPPPPPPAKEYNIDHLEKIWNDYHDAKLELQKKQHSLGLWARIPMFFSMGSGVLTAIVPDQLKPYLGVLTAISLVIMIVGFIQQKNFVFSEEMDKLENWFQDKYVCPNPDCHHFVGNIPFKILKTNPGCGYCKCKYKSQK